VLPQVPRQNKILLAHPCLMSNVPNKDQIQQKLNSSQFHSIPSASNLIDTKFFPIFQGIPLKGLTEIAGLPGSGKTCLA